MLAYFIKLSVRNFSQAIKNIGFFLISCCLAAYAASQLPEVAQWSTLCLFFVFLFSIMLGSAGMLTEERQEGVLEQWHLWPSAIELTLLYRILAHWLVQVTPLVLAVPLACIVMGLEHIVAICGVLLCVSLSIIPIAAAAELLMVSRQQHAAMAMMIVMPLSMPALLFGLGAVLSPESAQMPMLMLLGIACISWPICVFLGAKILRFSC